MDWACSMHGAVKMLIDTHLCNKQKIKFKAIIAHRLEKILKICLTQLESVMDLMVQAAAQ
jgi:hypothetical protein